MRSFVGLANNHGGLEAVNRRRHSDEHAEYQCEYRPDYHLRDKDKPRQGGAASKLDLFRNMAVGSVLKQTLRPDPRFWVFCFDERPEHWSARVDSPEWSFRGEQNGTRRIIGQNALEVAFVKRL